MRLASQILLMICGVFDLIVGSTPTTKNKATQIISEMCLAKRIKSQTRAASGSAELDALGQPDFADDLRGLVIHHGQHAHNQEQGHANHQRDLPGQAH
jgi:hypothetical protein